MAGAEFLISTLSLPVVAESFFFELPRLNTKTSLEEACASKLHSLLTPVKSLSPSGESNARVATNRAIAPRAILAYLRENKD